MPAKSKAQQTAAAIALHGKPAKGTAAAEMKKSMSKDELEKFATTKRKGLPKRVKENVRVVEDFKSLTFKQYLRIDESVLDFAKGAAGEIGRKVAGSAPVRAGRDVVQAGKAASVQGALATKIKQLAQLIGQFQQQAAGVKQNMPAQSAQAAQPAPAAKAGKPSDMTPTAFRAQNKPKFGLGQHGAEYQFASYRAMLGKDYDTYLEEGVLDFIKGAGSEIGRKFRGAVQQRGQSGIAKVVGDVVGAGAARSAQGKAQKSAEGANAAEQQVDSLATEILQIAQKMGDKGQAMMQIINQLGPELSLIIRRKLDQVQKAMKMRVASPQPAAGAQNMKNAQGA